MRYAVIFTYSYNNDTAVYLFEDYESAVKYLVGSYNEALKESVERMMSDHHVLRFELSEDLCAAKIIETCGGNTDVTEIRVGNIYD